MAAQLIVRRGPEPGKVYDITGDIVQIGRGARNDIIINDNDVSREHCRLIWRKTYYDIVDLDSVNGTFVNGQRVTGNWSLLTDCIVELGDSITMEYVPMPVHASALPSTPPSVDAQQAFLVVSVTSQASPAIYPLDGDEIEIGRGTTNRIIIIEPEVSRTHLRLTRTEEGFEVVDVGSTNGTSINGRELNHTHFLEEGDIMRIGANVTIQFSTNPDVFLSKKGTAVLEEKTDTKEISRKGLGVPGLGGMRDTIVVSEVGTGVEPEALADHVLLLYARSDWEQIVAPIFDHLAQVDIPVWVDQYLVQGGDDWIAAVEQARMECWLLMVVISRESVRLDHVVKIWRHFHNREKPVILIISEDVDRLPIGAKRDQQIVFDYDYPETSFRQIVNTIRQSRGM